MFSEECKKLCIENAERLREEWEPKVGDFCISKTQGLLCLIGARRKYEPKKHSLILISGQTALVRPGGRWDICSLDSIKEDFIPLFTLRQLIDMLEERGYYPGLQKCRKPDEWWAGAKPRGWDQMPTDTELTIQGLGPDPETALLKCLLEVVQDGLDT